MGTPCGGWGCCPIATFLFSTVGLGICYALSTAYGHVPTVPSWPLVSDMGIQAPERCVFAFFLNWYAAGLLFVSIGFYKIVKTRGYETRLNKSAMAFGVIVSVGISLAGSFEWNEAPAVHLVGAWMAFAGGVVYSWLIIAITCKYFRQSYPIPIISFRILNASAQTISSVLLAVYLPLQRVSKVPDQQLIAAVAEWVLMLLQTFYYATLAYDFKSVKGFVVELTGDAGTNQVVMTPPQRRTTTHIYNDKACQSQSVITTTTRYSEQSIETHQK